jgi:two-component system, response regulator PdtaR
MSGADASAHILIVDDDRLVLATLGKGLRGAGYRVSEAGEAATALKLVARDPPQLALLDVRMPDSSGITLAEQLASEHAVPFMFLSAYGDPEIIEQATRLGALGYLVKPLDVPQIIPSIEAALARAAQIRSLKDTGEQLNHALESSRETSVAIGILMERRGLDRQEAFEALRSYARSNRQRIHAVATELIEALEALNKVGRTR